MMKPICVKCQRFYRPIKNGTYFIEGMPKGNAFAEPGTEHPEQWKPYKLWVGDKWRCEGCGHELIVGVGLSPISEHYKSDFVGLIEMLNPKVQINDC